jgi:starch phosphorylase
MNEGHVAFLGLERARERVRRGDGLSEALADLALNAVFTTHTPVPAGNETFDRELVRKYIGPWTQDVGCDSEVALGLGTSGDHFNLTVMAIRLSSSVNGVSKLHGDVSSAMWRHLWPEDPERRVAYVTNGVHTPTWIGPEMRALFARRLGPDWEEHLLDNEYWNGVHAIADAELWAAHRSQKERLVRFVRERVRLQSARHGRSPDEMRAIEGLLDVKALTIGFARRFATYKRAVLVMSDLDRIRGILGDPARPVQLVFAGKAHPADRAGQDFIRQLVLLTQGEFRGKIVFVEDYDMEVGRMLVQGCDVWLNTPRRPQEASGTSGQKCPIGGGINASILDGWWAEGYRKDNGWAIGEETIGAAVDDQDRADAASLYRILEEEMVPLFFDKGNDGLRTRWIAMMKASIASCVPQFSAHRMVRDYVEEIYLPAASRKGRGNAGPEA